MHLWPLQTIWNEKRQTSAKNFQKKKMKTLQAPFHGYDRARMTSQLSDPFQLSVKDKILAW